MSTTRHENEAINVQGLKASLQKFKDDYVTDVAYLEEGEGSAAIADFDPQTDTVWKKAQTLSNAEKAQVKTNLGLPNEVYSKTEVNELVSTPHQNYVTVSTYAELPASGSTDTIYRVSNYDGTQVAAGVYSEYAWSGSAYVFLAAKSSVGEVFDISEYHAGTKYANLAAALDSNNGGGVPQSLQKGGMSVKYVSNSDNKYVQYRLMSDTFTTTESDWQGVDDEPIAGSDNLVKSSGVADKISELEEKTNMSHDEDKVYPKDVCSVSETESFVSVCISKDGKIIKSVDKKGKTTYYCKVDLKDDLILKSGETIDEVLNKKVTAIEGKSLIIREAADAFDYGITEWINCVIDKKGNIIEATDKQGVKHLFGGISICDAETIHADTSTDYVKVFTDANNRIYKYNKRDGIEVFCAGIEFDGIVAQNNDRKNIAKVSRCGSAFSALWFSDIHGSSINMDRIVQLANAWSQDGLLDAIINSGDTVPGFYTDGLDWYNSLVEKSVIPVLTATGNHDYWYLEVPGDWNTRKDVTQEQVYNLITKKVVSQANVVLGAPNRNYYYKDFNNVRVIVLDTEGWEDTQGVWLQETLENSLSGNKHVLCVLHHPFVKSSTIEDAEFVDTNFTSYNDVKVDWARSPISIFEAITSYKEEGGNFVGYLQGHTHCDLVYKMPNYDEGQLSVVIGSANSLGDSTLYYSDEYRDPENYTFDHINMISIDTDNCFFKILRIGVNMDRALRAKNQFVFDYKNNKIITLN